MLFIRLNIYISDSMEIILLNERFWQILPCQSIRSATPVTIHIGTILRPMHIYIFIFLSSWTYIEKSSSSYTSFLFLILSGPRYRGTRHTNTTKSEQAYPGSDKAARIACRHTIISCGKIHKAFLSTSNGAVLSILRCNLDENYMPEQNYHRYNF